MRRENIRCKPASWILLNQMGDKVLVLNEASPEVSRFLLVPGDFADRALVLGFLPE